jgi:HD-GYP domain-containing protein (c-di-GMP phosphodiesterase class II)
MGALGDAVAGISRVLAQSGDSILPLAPLKRHDEYTFVHTINVGILSAALGEALGFDVRTVHELNISALLHDIGKQMVPGDLLNKNGRFTDEEFRIVQLHPVNGARLLLTTSGVPELAAIVAFEHHIRVDGTGYPRVPSSWKLNLASRIVQVADVFDALRTNRPYREALTPPEIVEVMTRDAGTFFDPDLLDIFLRKVVSRGAPA